MNNSNNIKRAILSLFLVGLVGVWGGDQNGQRLEPVLEEGEDELRQAGSERPERAGSPDSVATLSDVHPNLGSSGREENEDTQEQVQEEKEVQAEVAEEEAVKYLQKIKELEPRLAELEDSRRELERKLNLVWTEIRAIHHQRMPTGQIEKALKIISDYGLFPDDSYYYTSSADSKKPGSALQGLHGKLQRAKALLLKKVRATHYKEQKRKALICLCIFAMAGFKRDWILKYLNDEILSKIRVRGTNAGLRVARIEQSNYENVELRIEKLKENKLVDPSLRDKTTSKPLILEIATDFVDFLDGACIPYSPMKFWKQVKGYLST